MRLQGRSLRQITGRCRDFHAFARTQVEHITHMRARVYRDGQIGGRQKKAEKRTIHIHGRHKKSSKPYCKTVALVTLVPREFLAKSF